MENSSIINQSLSFDQEIWLADTVINGLLSVISIYLLIALLFYKIKIEKRNEEHFLRLVPEKRYGILSTYLCIFIAVASLICQTNAFTRKLIEENSIRSNLSASQQRALQTACKIMPPLGNFAITLGSAMVYTFLWFRQRVFYIHPSLKVLNSRCINIFSFTIIVFWFVFYVSIDFAYFSLVHYRFDEELGCVVGTYYAVVKYRQIITSWTIASIVMQIVLLLLFIYPILKRTLWKGQLQSERSVCLMRRVKKAVVLTSACLGSDVAAVVATVLLLQEDSSNIIFVYGVNLVINLLVTIACFDHWKKLIFPWHLKPETSSQTPSHVSSPPTKSYSKDISFTDESHL